jgi:hypothetical protein
MRAALFRQAVAGEKPMLSVLRRWLDADLDGFLALLIRLEAQHAAAKAEARQAQDG